ncbi:MULTISPECIES: undecaprenyl-diphosphate phosphatase [Methanosphaera]|uniref:Undecaprenyl-diphosphatase n=1 Tax=Methanosphaera stadtmanae (strain ATCC 43021 / DSM 3091 / JCM 11832 / MCB-3) TaxID=339860 RepID=UPPP_METST|nr:MULTISPECIES: undecaprenyl-diphosphate phosphatase [Methanosphaera]Q2NIA2.1 RecName: Full=Undecaprenyl-diphosphatase; AltName: Full=Undecaprenyl pyrophosphate phosphatase [Methanosphaera stadtmanae DSM 3091]ABC56434.1 UppP [Methanosphaera stadtmanae DSM 3091]OEC87136.1 undecaprenyl-diphosphatase [Methanosphaera sp. A6]
MLDILSAIILGAVQGISEFLPISSSGHLVLVPALLGIETGLAFDTILHIGTLVAIFTFFWKDIINLIKGFILSIIDLTEGVDIFKRELHRVPEKRFAWLIIVGTIPTGIMGILLKDAIETIFRGTLFVGIFLLVTAAVLYYSERHSSGQITQKDMSFKQALIVGICQGLAVFPGISRSGSTIASGLCLGLNREYAARYSFLLSIPAVIGAGLIQIKDIATLDASASVLLAGFISSVIFGYLSIKLLMKMIKGWSLDIFAYYCTIIGIITIILSVVL